MHKQDRVRRARHERVQHGQACKAGPAHAFAMSRALVARDRSTHLLHPIRRNGELGHRQGLATRPEGGDVDLDVDVDVDIESTSGDIGLAATQRAEITGQTGVDVKSLAAGSSVAITAAAVIELSSDGLIAAEAPNITFAAADVFGATLLSTGGDVNVHAAGNLGVQAAEAVTVSSHLGVSASNGIAFQSYGAAGIDVAASHQLQLSSAEGNATLSGNNGVDIVSDAGDVHFTAGRDVTMIAAQNVSLSAGNSVSMHATAQFSATGAAIAIAAPAAVWP